MRNERFRMGGLGLAALVALAGCDQLQRAEGPDEGQAAAAEVKYTEDGRPLITLGVSMKGEAVEAPAVANGPSKALFANQAKGYDFLEVVFKDEKDSYYSASVRRPETLKISVPKGTYDGTSGKGDAILLLGYYNRGSPTLLAIGKLDVPSQTISVTTPSVAFDVYALTTDIADASGTNNSLAYTIPVVGTMIPAAIPVDKPEGYIEVTNNVTDTVSTVTPFFNLPLDTQAAQSGYTTTDTTFTIEVPAGMSVDNMWKKLAMPADNTGAGITDTPQPSFNFMPKSIIMGADTTNPYPDGDVTGEQLGTFGDMLKFDTNKIKIGFAIKLANPSSTFPGTSMFYFDVPVMGLDAEYDGTTKKPKNNKKAMLWHLRNGLTNTDLDSGMIYDKYDGTGTSTGIGTGGAGILFEIGTSGLNHITVTQNP